MSAVLVVDNDLATCETLRYLLEDADYTPILANNGPAGLTILREYPQPLVVLFDFMMPEMDGDGFMDAVLRDGERATRHAFICITASPQKFLAGVHAHIATLQVPVITKPFNIDALLQAIADAYARLDSATV